MHHLDAVLSSFHFQAPPPPPPVTFAVWTDPRGLVQLQYPKGWTATIDQTDEDNVLELVGPDGTYFYVDVYDPQTRAPVADEVRDDMNDDAKNTRFTYVDSPATA